LQSVPQILPCFKISSTILHAFQCSKKLANPMTVTDYALLPKSRHTCVYIFSVHQVITSGGKFNIFLARTRTKIPLRMHQNTPFQVEKSFSAEGLFRSANPSRGGEGYYSHITNMSIIDTGKGALAPFWMLENRGSRLGFCPDSIN